MKQDELSKEITVIVSGLFITLTSYLLVVMGVIITSLAWLICAAYLLSVTCIYIYRLTMNKNIQHTEEPISNLLKFLNGYTIPDDIVDGFWEDLYEKGFTDEQMHSVIDLGLVKYITKKYLPTTEEVKHSHFIPDKISWFDLTNLGKKLI